MSISQSRQTFVKPAIPFSWTIRGGLLPGEMILIQGAVPSDADRSAASSSLAKLFTFFLIFLFPTPQRAAQGRWVLVRLNNTGSQPTCLLFPAVTFQVDLTCGSSVRPRADVIFHLNPRVKKAQVVCNTLQAGRWGREEILQRMPFARGAPFELLLLALSDRFKVAVNGAHVLDYKHRLALERVDTLAVSGKVQVDVVAVLQQSTPSPSAGAAAAAAGGDAERPRSADDNASSRMLVMSADPRGGFRGELSGGLRVGSSIAIRGQVNQGAERFTVNLRVGDSDDTALHVNPRFKHKMIVLNSFLSGSWGAEERRVDTFPFAPGSYFEMIIRCDPDSFRVAVNGVHQLDYKYRVQRLLTITQLQVTGDLSLMDARLM